MDSPSPIFILSCERSGSTLLHYILDTHPDICCPGELYVGQLSKLLRLAVSRTTGFITPGTLEERDGVVRREVRRILDGFLSDYAGTRGKKIWCDKTPFNLNDLRDLDWAFPDARYLCLHRDSRDVVQSCLELPEKAPLWWALPYLVKHPQNYPAALLENWVEKTENLLTFESGQSRAYRIGYESLVADPVGTLDPVFKFLGLEWNPALLEMVFAVPHDPGGGDFKIKSTHKIEKDRVGKGTRLDPALWARVPAALKVRQQTLHRKLGYAEI